MRQTFFLILVKLLFMNFMKNTRRCLIFKQTRVSPVNYISSTARKSAHNIKGNFSALKMFPLFNQAPYLCLYLRTLLSLSSFVRRHCEISPGKRLCYIYEELLYYIAALFKCIYVHSFQNSMLPVLMYCIHSGSMCIFRYTQSCAFGS